MKVTLELDTAIPEHKQLLHQILDPGPDVRTFADQPVAPTPQPQETVAPPTPVSNLRDELNQAFVQAFAKSPGDAENLAAKFRASYGVDANNWTEQQLKTAVTETQALVRF